MTDLKRTVKRVTGEVIPYGPDRGKRLVVALLAPNLIYIRPKGCQRGYTITVRQAWQLGAETEAAYQRAEKARQRKIKRATR